MKAKKTENNVISLKDNKGQKVEINQTLLDELSKIRFSQKEIKEVSGKNSKEIKLKKLARLLT